MKPQIPTTLLKKKTLNKQDEISQLNMGLKFSRFAFLQNISYKLKKSTLILEQFSFWRSPLLWLHIFIITFTTIYKAIFIYQHRLNLPNEIPLFFFHQDLDARFINTDSILILIATNVILNIISIFISSRLFFKFKTLSHLIIICSIISNIFFAIGLFKVLRLTLF